MNNWDELAHWIVSLGYGTKTKMTAGHHSWWVYSYNQTAEQFCKDGRTVLAVMSLVEERLNGNAETLAEDIIIACREELEEDEE